jgi:hypothetical protein
VGFCFSLCNFYPRRAQVKTLAKQEPMKSSVLKKNYYHGTWCISRW